MPKAKSKKSSKAKKSVHKTASKAAKSVSTPVKQVQADYLIMFHGRDCLHCRNMDPVVARLEKETGLKITKLEVWNDEKNAELLRKTDQGMCNGVPFFWNSKTKKWFCGEADYETLKDWAGA